MSDQDVLVPCPSPALIKHVLNVLAPCRPELVLTVLDGLDIQVPRNVSHFLSEQQHAHFLECRYRDARNFLQVWQKRYIYIYIINI